MKKKIGIVTLYGLFNYGNRLQNYATQTILEDLGYSVNTIVNLDIINRHRIINRLRYYIKLILKKDYRLTYTKEKERTKKFVDFEREYIKEYRIKAKDLKKLKDKFDFFALGSDQVWNPYYMQSKDFYFLNFCDRNQKITIAPSIGLNTLPNEYTNIYKEYLINFDEISCREQEGAKILERLTNKKVFESLDPTMLVSPEEWLKICQKPQISINNNFIVLYFLGEITEEYQEFIKRRETEGYSVINLLDKSNKFFSLIGPREFLWLIKNSSLVITDSFHACVFSILFEKAFVVFERCDSSGEMTSRINTLLNKMGLQDRLFKNVVDIYHIDYSKTRDFLKKEKEKSLNFLINCLKR